MILIPGIEDSMRNREVANSESPEWSRIKKSANTGDGGGAWAGMEAMVGAEAEATAGDGAIPFTGELLRKNS